jgi:integral membrane sensor domain MASE1
VGVHWILSWCKIGFALTFQPHPVSVLWPPNSVLVAALLLTPPRSWWLVLLAVSYAVLYELRSGADLALLFLPLPFLLWVTVRFGALGASTAISIVGFLAIWSASHGHGPFSGGTAEQSALSIEIFLIGLAIPLLFLAALIEERVTGENELRESESRFQIVAPRTVQRSGAVSELREGSSAYGCHH